MTAKANREDDRRHMARCIELAAQYRGRTTPNPLVGCVIVDRHGKVVAEGAHVEAGKPHAEIVALKKIGKKASGCTLYVNLEPCNHHGRTPPCAPVVRESDVARVVIGTEDPIVGHGGGIEMLRRAGIAVSVGVLREQCERLNVAWLTHAIKGRPAFTLKAAVTLDGKIATIAGNSKWITGDLARANVMRLRHEHDAVLCGINTVLKDDPWLTARLVGGRDPIRVIVDSMLRTPPKAHLLPKRRPPRTIIACTEAAPKANEQPIKDKGGEIWRLPAHANGRVVLRELARRLGDENIQSVLVEGGGEIHAAMFRAELADELVLYLAPIVVGGPAPSWVGGEGYGGLKAAHKLAFDEEMVRFGNDLRITARVLPINPLE